MTSNPSPHNGDAPPLELPRLAPLGAANEPVLVATFICPAAIPQKRSRVAGTAGKWTIFLPVSGNEMSCGWLLLILMDQSVTNSLFTPPQNKITDSKREYLRVSAPQKITRWQKSCHPAQQGVCSSFLFASSSPAKRLGFSALPWAAHRHETNHKLGQPALPSAWFSASVSSWRPGRQGGGWGSHVAQRDPTFRHDYGWRTGYSKEFQCQRADDHDVSLLNLNHLWEDLDAVAFRIKHLDRSLAPLRPGATCCPWLDASGTRCVVLSCKTRCTKLLRF